MTHEGQPYGGQPHDGQDPRPLGFAAFRDHVAEQIDVDLSGRPAEARLVDDLELDSIQRLEALVGVEELGVHLPDDSVGPEQTLGGLHRLYVQALQGATPP
jgi:acyl carrier protein